MKKCKKCGQKIKVRYTSQDGDHGVIDWYWEYGHTMQCPDYEKQV